MNAGMYLLAKPFGMEKLTDSIKPRRTVGRLNCRVAQLIQNFGYQHAHGRLIIDDENGLARRRASPPGCDGHEFRCSLPPSPRPLIRPSDSQYRLNWIRGFEEPIVIDAREAPSRFLFWRLDRRLLSHTDFRDDLRNS
jgi:hypothetical protein